MVGGTVGKKMEREELSKGMGDNEVRRESLNVDEEVSDEFEREGDE